MPGPVDGLVAIRQLRNDPDTADIPIVVVSAWGSAKHKERALIAGADAHFTKPVSMDGLIATQLTRYKKNLYALEERKALYRSGEVPLSLSNEIDLVQEKIDTYQRSLGGWNDGFTDTSVSSRKSGQCA